MTEANVATNGKTGTDQGFKKDVQRLGRYVGQLHEDLSGIARGASEAAHSGLAEVREEGKNALDAAQAKGKRATANLRSQMEDHPGTTLGIAVGLGILLGLAGTAIVRSRGKAS